MHSRFQNILLATLPILLLAIVAFAQAQRGTLLPLSVTSDGSELIYQTFRANSLYPSQLHRDQNGVTESINLSVTKPQTHPVCVATESTIVCFVGDKFSFFDRQNFSNVDHRSFAKSDALQFLLQLVLSENQRYLFFQTNSHPNDEWSIGIIDLNSLDATWEFEMAPIHQRNFFYGASTPDLTRSSDLVRVENTIAKFIRQNNGNFVADELLAFENGLPSRTGSNASLFTTTDGQFTVQTTLGTDIEVRDKERDVLEFIKTAPSGDFEIIAQFEDGFLFENNRNLNVFNRQRMRVENVIPHKGVNAGDVVISRDGKAIARTVSEPNLTWSDFLQFGCQQRRQYIEVVDAMTGTQIRIVENKPPFLLLAFLAFGGSIAWTTAWLRSSQQAVSTVQTISSIVVVSLLWLFLFTTRLVLGGYVPEMHQLGFIDIDRPISVGFICTLGSMMAMAMVWLFFSTHRFSQRVLIAGIGVSLLWALLAIPWHVLELSNKGLRFECLWVAVYVLSSCFVMRMFGWRICRKGSTPIAETNRPYQLTLVELLMAPVAVGLAITVFRAVLADVDLRHLALTAIEALPLSLAVMLSLYAAFSNASKPRWILGFIFAIAILATVSRFHFWNELAIFATSGNRPTKADQITLFVFRYLVLSSGVGLYVLISMCLLRQQGWRMRRTSRTN